MADRYVVIDKHTGVIVDAVMLDGPEPDNSDVRYVLCDGTAGIGWTVTDKGCVPPADIDVIRPTVEQIADEIAALQAKLDAFREVTQ